MQRQFGYFVFIITILFTSNIVECKASNLNFFNDPSDTLWVDSVFNSLTDEEKIAQLFIVRAYSSKKQSYYKGIIKLIENFNIGGLCFFQGSPVCQAKFTNEYQSIAKTPLFIAIDAEWGLGMRLDSTYSFPFEMTLGAIQNDSLIYEMSCEIARQCKCMGININFAPVIDVNCNPDNPVINSRSFGEDKYNVAKKGIVYMKGLQDNGILATAKHFPGHGDTDSDSHLTLPVINHSTERLDTIELYPFQELIKTGLRGIMVAHLYIPAYDAIENTPTTLSKPVVTQLLKNEMKFNGLIFTDALDMKGVTKYYKPGDIEVKALMAGNDILLLPQDLPMAIKRIKSAIDKGIITQSEIDEKCKKILTYKHILGLSEYKPIKIENLYNDINNSNCAVINRKLYESAITIIKNNNDILPLKNFDTLKLASVSIGATSITNFQEMFENYALIDNYILSKEPSNEEIISLLKQLSKYDLVIAGIHNTNIFANKNFGISQKNIDFIKTLKNNTKVILDIFANPYSIAYFDDTKNIEAIIISYQDNKISEEVSAQIIFGSLSAKGKLPVSASADFPINTGFETSENGKLKYSIPEEAGISSKDLNPVDSIALSAIDNKTYPGCQIMIVKEGKVIYNKSFGYHTYAQKSKVKNTDLYDLASLTKIAATTLSIMKLSDEDKIDIDQELVEYLPYLKGSNKENIIIRDLMTHQAKLETWIPFYLNTIIDGKLNSTIYNNVITENFPYRVAENIYIQKNYSYTLFDSIIKSPLRKKNEYKYSDLGFYYLMKIIENVTNQPFEIYVKDNFYLPLNLTRMCFHPRNKFSLSEIIPTENDTFFRKQLIHGDVHDPGAAMLGGVSGHAGLFSNANDMAVIMQMLLQNGEYADNRYIDSSTVKEFTKRQFPLNDNRRGIGFDKPLTDNKEEGPTCKSVSNKSFGHSGFTGTYAWADPEENLIYIFLSNRIHPDVSNTKLIDMNIRTNIQKVIYQAIKKAKNHNNLTKK
ncbi:MAG: serine hydrolase [Bacteroidales bacterium]|nr:serine hydrolase [Bacteroidales bacterium]